MKAEITMQQMWANPSVRSFFAREQAERELCKLMDLVVYSGKMSHESFFNQIENYYESYDEFVEVLYNETTEDILEWLGLSDILDDEEDDDDEC